MQGKLIHSIATLELHTYADFCRWLRSEKETTMSKLIQESDVIQRNMLTEFLQVTGRE